MSHSNPSFTAIDDNGSEFEFTLYVDSEIASVKELIEENITPYYEIYHEFEDCGPITLEQAFEFFNVLEESDYTYDMVAATFSKHTSFDEVVEIIKTKECSIVAVEEIAEELLKDLCSDHRLIMEYIDLHRLGENIIEESDNYFEYEYQIYIWC